MNNAHWLTSRNVVKRIIIKADLVLETPASLGSGERDGVTDTPLLLDPLQGRALLTGASLAGALRSYLRERELGYRQKGRRDKANNRPLYALLFGGMKGDKADLGEQSPLITYDALGGKPAIELRDSVKLKTATHTAEDGKKFDMELLEAGTVFPIKLELLVIAGQENDLKQALAYALQGFEKGQIPLGGRKRRGLGQCRVTEWQVWYYDMKDKTGVGLLGWLADSGQPQTGKNIVALLDVSPDTLADKRRSFNIEATFALDSSLLIRSGSGEASDPDMVHLHSKRNGQLAPILSGTSLAGALRARATRIANTLNLPTVEIINGIFGSDVETSNKTNLSASRLIFNECIIENGIDDKIQNRVTLDRFTGGSYSGALFNQRPLIGRTGHTTTLTVKLTLQRSAEQKDSKFEAEVGLLLLLLKDLWTGDLPLGGESSVGRGRLQGLCAVLRYDEQEWRITQAETNTLYIENGDKNTLEKFVQALQKEASV